MNLNITYLIWKTLAQNNSWAVYHYVDGSNTRRVWSGDRDHIYESFVSADDFADWGTNFSSASISVSLPDDAIAQIVGLTGIRPTPLSSDGTPLLGKQPLKLGRLPFKRIDNATEVMNVNGLPVGATVLIWDGDTTAWTRSGEGTVTTQSAHSGTYGLDSGTVGANTSSIFDNGSEIDVGGVYSTLSVWIQPKAYPGNAVLQLQWKNAAGTTIGSTLNVENYVSNMDLDVWQKVTIPIADFNLGANVRKLYVVYKVGTQRHWFDEFYLQAAGGGGPYTFRTSSPAGTIYHVERLVFVMSAGGTGWSSSNFGTIVGGLTNGLLLKHHRIGDNPETYWSFNVKTNAELFGLYHVFNDVQFDDGVIFIAFDINPDLSSVILIDDDEVLDFVIRDNLSSLGAIRAFLHYGSETVA